MNKQKTMVIINSLLVRKVHVYYNSEDNVEIYPWLYVTLYYHGHCKAPYPWSYVMLHYN